MRSSLAGRKVLVVGAGTRASDDPDAPVGNGRAIAITAGRAGATVACGHRRGLGALHRRPRRGRRGDGAACSPPTSPTPAPAPPSSTEPSRRWPASTASCSTSASGAGMGMTGTTPEQWDRVFAVNVRAHFLLAGAALGVMPEGSAIVFISSIAGLTAGTRIPPTTLEVGAARALPPDRGRGRPQGHPRQHRRSGPHRHAAGPGRHRWSALPRQGPRAPRAPGHRVGGGGAGGVPPQRRRQLHHEPAAVVDGGITGCRG